MTVQTVVLRDNAGKIIGRLDLQNNGDKMLRDFQGRILGRYHASTNLTTDFRGNIVGRGDVLTMLLKP